MDNKHGHNRWVMTNRDIIDELVRVQWLVEWALWREYLDKFVYNAEIDMTRHLIANVYGFDDVDDVFPQKFERSEMKRVINTIFRTFTEMRSQSIN